MTLWGKPMDSMCQGMALHGNGSHQQLPNAVKARHIEEGAGISGRGRSVVRPETGAHGRTPLHVELDMREPGVGRG